MPRSRLVGPIRCVWSFLALPPTTNWRFPFKLPKHGPENSKGIALSLRGCTKDPVAPQVAALVKQGAAAAAQIAALLAAPLPDEKAGGGQRAAAPF